jgi:hypothetical protein
MFGQSRESKRFDGCRGHLRHAEVGRVRGENSVTIRELHGNGASGGYFVGARSIGLEIVSCGAGVKDTGGCGSGIGGVMG